MLQSQINKQGDFVGSDLEVLSFETSEENVKYEHKVILRKDDSPEAKSSALLRLKQMIQRQISEQRLYYLDKMLTLYANDHDSAYPDRLEQIKAYDIDEWLDWLLENVEYVGKGMTSTKKSSTVLAYDKTLLGETGSTNVLFNHKRMRMQYQNPDQLKKLGITGNQKSNVQAEAEDVKKTDSLVWGEEVNGLRAAVELIPEKKTYNIGEKVKTRFHIQNASGNVVNKYEKIGLGVQIYGKLTDAKSTKLPHSKPLMVIEWESPTWPVLQPWEAFVLDDGEIDIRGFDKNGYRGSRSGGSIVYCKPGLHFLSYELKFNTKLSLETGKRKLVVVKAEQKPAVQVEKDKRPVAIETKFLIVPESFLKEIGIASSSLDPDEEGGGKPGSMRRLAGMLGQQGITEILLTGGQLDDLQVEFLLRATMVQKNTRIITYPQIIVRNNETGTLNTIFMPFTLDVKPTITTDDKDIMLQIDLEYSDILKREKKMYKEKYPYKIPQIRQVRTTFNVLVSNKNTFLLNGPTITSTVEDEDGNSVQVPMRLILLIKPTIKPEHDDKTDPAEAAKMIQRLLRTNTN